MNILDDRLTDPMQKVFQRLCLEDLVHLSQTNSQMRSAVNQFLQNLPRIKENWTIQHHSSLGSSLIASLHSQPDGQYLIEIALRVLGGEQEVDSENQPSNRIIITENKEETAIDPTGQAVRIARQYENNYHSFWAALRQQNPQLPELADARAIRAWLLDPQNSQALTNIKYLVINDPRFTFFPPEAKPLMAGLETLEFGVLCTSLQSLNLQGLTSLEFIFYLSFCTSLQTLNLKGLTTLKMLDCSGCHSLQSVNLQGCTALGVLEFSGCHSLQRLNLQGLTALEHLNYCDCYSLQNLDLQGLAALELINGSGCRSLQSLNLQGLTALQTLICLDCPSLQISELQELPVFTYHY